MEQNDKQLKYKTTSFYKKLSKQIIILISLIISVGYQLGFWEFLLTENLQNQLLDIVMLIITILSTIGILLPGNDEKI
ncbi:hypothetical protein [Bacillus thuringiensis]|uniref:Uncharacterized protein n=1 Tax=Bacillus thuringiensis TaxID=1428 RepID=A0A9W3YKP5_BACTU|nr:hypothetical protein [Bacillus thuringiensis]MEC2715585.1 hypothetical protein [Bacillus cereus]AMR06150.1 hypothetical protein AXW78_30455 [Bacillus thuringiensis]AYF84874.1 hypothetical protein D7J84_27970 [Bacillus thuringiensis]MEC2745321.1 hypothetical protein [Bacillus cereus]MEC2758381.1 hypothetical protein [Bacillus cereus]